MSQYNIHHRIQILKVSEKEAWKKGRHLYGKWYWRIQWSNGNTGACSPTYAHRTAARKSAMLLYSFVKDQVIKKRSFIIEEIE